jgi:hypothetical protein
MRCRNDLLRVSAEFLVGANAPRRMERVRPRLWPYNPASSPVALPEVDVLFTSSEVVPLTASTTSAPDDMFDLDALRSWAGTLKDDQGESLGDLLNAEGAAPLDQRRPFLMLGELANPFRLASLQAEAVPILRVRLEGLCRTWTDSQDARHIQPGLHHVTLARTPGWWEEAHLGLLSPKEMKRFTMWLAQDRQGDWRGVRVAEGGLRLEHAPLDPPAIDDVAWDGSVERVERPAPAPTGAGIDLASVMVPVHARRGCYDHRGRLARCVHLPQRAFHEDVFRRGSARDWSDVLDTLG